MSAPVENPSYVPHIWKREWQRTYRAKNKDKVREQGRLNAINWRKNNPEKIKEIKKRDYEKNKDRYKEKSTRWRLENRDKYNEYMRMMYRRRQALKNRPKCPSCESIIKDGESCEWCQRISVRL